MPFTPEERLNAARHDIATHSMNHLAIGVAIGIAICVIAGLLLYAVGVIH